MKNEEPEGVKSKLKKTTMMMLAVTLHNVPEGMAIGVTFAGAVFGNTGITITGAIVLAIGIAIQNFPEGAIIAMPLKSEGISKPKAFLYGTLSGIVEPIGAILTMLLTHVIVPLLPYLLSFAAGAMIYVVVEELIPESQTGEHCNALVPIVTVIGMEIPVMFGGAVIVEQVFSWPGLGLMTMSAITSRDFPVIMGVCLLSGAPLKGPTISSGE